DYTGVAAKVRERAEQGEPGDAIGVPSRKQGCNRGAHGVTGDDGAFDMHNVEEGDGVGDEAVDAIARARLARLTVAALGERQRAQAMRQMRDQRQERVPAVGEAVQQQQGLAGERAVLDVLDGDAGGEGYVLDLRVHSFAP